ncbi:MAG: glycosyltransferase family 4 protein [Chloroflexi bacterium]|nr:glycosyltransferase family 4 protein [Chloroflexota bacterium]
MLTMPHVLFYSHSRGFSGAEVSLERMLGVLPQRGVAITVATSATSVLADHLARAATGVRLVAGPALDIGSRTRPAAALGALLRANLQLAGITRRVQPDLIHANSLRAGMACLLAAKMTRTPLIVHLRDILPKSGAALSASRLLLAQATRVIAISEYVERRLPIPKGRSAVIYDGIDVAHYQRPSNAVLQEQRRDLGMGDTGGPVLMILGQLTPWKGHADAIRALATVRAAGHNAHLVVVGGLKFTHTGARYDNASYLAELHRQVAVRGLAKSVHWLGERTDVPSLLHTADYVLVPSWQEPFGLVVIEAMAAAKVVIATSVGGPSEIIRHGETGFLVQPHTADAIAAVVLRCIQEPARVHQVALAAQQEVARRFSLETFANKLAELYALVPIRRRAMRGAA